MTEKLSVKTIGQGSPLVMIHGWGWHSGIWSPLIHQLTPHFQLFLIDLPGFGDSPLLKNGYSIKAVTEAIFELVPEEATWVGWSLGGMIAWWVALYHPHKITRLVTIASSPKFVGDENWPGVSPSVLEKFKHSLLNNYQQTLHDFLDLQLRGSLNSAQLFQQLKHQLPTSDASPLDALMGSLELLNSLDLRKDLHKIQCPSLHLFGSHDTLVPAAVSSKIEPMLANGKCEMIRRTGHMPFLTHTDHFISQLVLL